MRFKKGQANIEYIVAMVIFVTFVIYISFQVAGAIPFYHGNSMNNRLYSDCFRITENMVKDSRLVYGFAKQPYDLNFTKLEEFNDTCNGNPSNFEAVYEKIKGNMSLAPERDFRMRVHIDGSIDFVCGRKYVPSQMIVASIERYAITGGNSTSIMLSVW
jgi:hypothetical protein